LYKKTPRVLRERESRFESLGVGLPGVDVVRSDMTREGAGVPRAVLFDMDDTIFDHSLTCRDALAEVRRTYPAFRGRPLDRLWDEYDRLLGITHTDVMLGRRTSEEVRAERFRSLAEWAGRPIPSTTAVEVSRFYRRHYQRLRRAVPGAVAAVRRWHDRARVVVVTNNTVQEQVEKIAFLGLEAAVDLLVTSEEVGVAKPDPRIFRTALERAGVAPTESVMVGDSWSSDIEGALSADLRAVWFNRFREIPPRPAPVPEFRSFRAPRQLDRLVARA